MINKPCVPMYTIAYFWYGLLHALLLLLLLLLLRYLKVL
jgi:hypothetical protein